MGGGLGRQETAAGFDGYQAKPIRVKELLEAVRQTLERRRAAGA